MGALANELRLQFRRRHHAGIFPAEPPVAVPGNKPVYEITNWTRNDDETIKQWPGTTHLPGNFQKRGGM